MPRSAAKYRIDRSRSSKGDRESLTLSSDSDDDYFRSVEDGAGNGKADHHTTATINASSALKTSNSIRNDKDTPDYQDDNQEFTHSQDSNDNDQHIDDSDSEDDIPAKNPRRRTVPKQKRPTRSSRGTLKSSTPSTKSRRPAIQDDDDEEEEDDDEYDDDNQASSSSDEEFVDEDVDQDDFPVKRPVRTRRTPPNRPQRSSRRKMGLSEKEAASMDSDNNDSDDYPNDTPPTIHAAGASGRRRPKRQPNKSKGASSVTRKAPIRNVATKKNHKSAVLYPQDTLAGLPSPKRSSAIKARNKVKSVAKVEEKGSDQDVDSDEYSGHESESKEEYVQPKKTSSRTPRKKQGNESSDEEFHIDSESSNGNSSEEASLSDPLDEDDEEIAANPDQSHIKKYLQEQLQEEDNAKGVNIDNEQVGTADESSDDDVPVTSRRNKSAKSEIRPSPRKGRYQGLDSCSSSEDNDEEDEQNPAPNKAASILPPCPSRLDAITAEELPRRHVCYISPDGQSRICFQLETLRQIALKSSQLQLRTDLDGMQRQTFLQPPHFRTAASDDLLDQIASRFGRDALDLFGPYYNQKHSSLQVHEREDSSDDDGFGVYALETFRDRVQKYFQNSMGSQDIYVCPLCYGQSHRLIVNPEADDDDETVPLEGNYDPMHVLGNLDKDEFVVASQFCFTRASNIKKHLRSDHNIDTREVRGNDLYMRWKVRAPDGLLQRWLAYYYNQKPKQGYMKMYWYQGNSQSFILLLDLMKRGEIYSGIATDPDSTEEEKEMAEEYLQRAENYYESFSSLVPALWKSIASPFAESAVNMKEFIVEDDEVEDESEDENTNHASLHRQLAARDDESDENDLVHKLQRKYVDENEEEEDYINDESSEDELEITEAKERNADDEEEEEEDDDDDEKMKGYYSPVEEEKDEWILSRLARRKRTSLSTPSLQQENVSKRTAR
ncbi:hypothetical protein IV203_016227 [Nitzschia inconspicua]|uniref:Uncharacterized protein n=1 Tax=Nitzschia inconspicua TaxID=303405 RepID=A0A9K3KPL7_9STRA|nr:hypothetical protein IV203_016227 [Nitzschia inconspicua]